MKKDKVTRMLSKIKRHDENTYCGQLTPTEILMLGELGVETDSFVKEDKNKGDSSPRWFYFIPNKKIRAIPGWEELVKH